jgi:hypothetical protein
MSLPENPFENKQAI